MIKIPDKYMAGIEYQLENGLSHLHPYYKMCKDIKSNPNKVVLYSNSTHEHTRYIANCIMRQN